MRWHRIPQDEEPEALLSLGIRLHGHLGPFMVAGLRTVSYTHLTLPTKRIV